MILKLVTNPIIICIFLFCLTYITLYYKESKRIEKDTVAKRRPIGLFVPITVAILGYFIAYKCGAVLSNECEIDAQNNVASIEDSGSQAILQTISNPIIPKFSKIGDVTNITNNMAGGMANYKPTSNLIGKGDIRLPQPDIFIELANF